jgi:hypothetical protein
MIPKKKRIKIKINHLRENKRKINTNKKKKLNK